ncbi:hypothetical protein [Arthrobacter sp. JSM 101049]|uniref:hypothetical protein n=1 Tax=Arthrobacter sp. JSM 101049 TaxID=929097 RepID=UPI00356836B3
MIEWVPIPGLEVLGPDTIPNTNIPWDTLLGNLSGAAIGGIAILMILTGRLATRMHVKALTDQIADKTATIHEQAVTIREQRDMLVTLSKSTQTIEHVGSVVEHTMSTISDQKAGD